jgi:hypothetical protein
MTDRDVGVIPVTSELTGWQPDPFLVHEFRFYSDDGKPTLLVSDGGSTSHDPPPFQPDLQLVRTPETDAALVRTPEAVGERSTPSGADVEVLEISYMRLDPDRTRVPVALPLVESPPRREEPEYGAAAPLVSRSAKIIYGVILVAMALSALALLIIHLEGHNAPPKAVASSSTTTTPTTAANDTTTTILTLPSGLQSSAAVAAADLISSWASGNQAEALTVATAPAVAVLFAGHYTPGLVIDRGCSVAFSPIVCTYGPPGGAAPTDPIYEIDVTQAAGGWYVSAAKLES